MRFISLGLLIAALFVASPWVQAQQAANSPVTVYKTPTCNCCSAWVEYLEDEGFTVTTHDLTDLTEIKVENGLTDPKLASCHTAIVDGYVVEGHVPANDIRRLLRERPPLVGITAPGMPQQSPGMFSRDPKGYDVLGFDANGKVSVFSRY
jgi:hypothetical protein